MLHTEVFEKQHSYCPLFQLSAVTSLLVTMATWHSLHSRNSCRVCVCMWHCVCVFRQLEANELVIMWQDSLLLWVLDLWGQRAESRRSAVGMFVMLRACVRVCLRERESRIHTSSCWSVINIHKCVKIGLVHWYTAATHWWPRRRTTVCALLSSALAPWDFITCFAINHTNLLQRISVLKLSVVCSWICGCKALCNADPVFFKILFTKRGRKNWTPKSQF